MIHAARVATPLDFVVTTADDEEQALVRRAQAREQFAFEQLYRTHVRRVYAICLRMTANPTQAEDLTQRAFIAVWDKLPLFRGESAFGSWLHRLAVNTVLSALRAEKRLAERLLFTDDPVVHETPAAPALAGIQLDLEAAISSLPTQARIVFVLHDVEGWQHEEIAEKLGVAVGTTKAQLHRARKLLQEALR